MGRKLGDHPELKKLARNTESITEKVEEERREEAKNEGIPGKVKTQLPSGITFVRFSPKVIASDGKRYREAVYKAGDKKYSKGQKVVFRITRLPPGKDKNPEGEILESVGDEKYRELVKKRRSLRFNELVDEVDQVLDSANERIEQKASERVADIEKKYDQRQERLKEKEENLEARKERVEEAERDLTRFHEEGGPEFMAFLRAQSAQPKEDRDLVETSDIPNTFWQDVNDQLANSGYRIQDRLIPLQFVLSAVVGAATGQLVVLSGPTGVGKTSLVRKMSQILQVGPEDPARGVVPVRPAWIDSTDLLGFHNPADNRFEPTPFLDELVEAKRYETANELYFVVLDEMNLSRIENYGADLLAKLEKSRGETRDFVNRGGLSLYSDAIEQRMRRRIKHLADVLKEDTDPKSSWEKREEFRSLTSRLERYPSTFSIPQGLVLFGTVNADETTYAFSPKFKDRSFIIQLPPASLGENLLENKESTSIEPAWTLTRSFVEDIDFSKSLPDAVKAEWSQIIDWNDQYLKPMGIHLSHRFAMLFRHYVVVAREFGWANDDSSKSSSLPFDLKDVVSAFARSKILPWISFHREDPSPGPSDTKREVLQAWAEDESLESYGPLKTAVETIIEDSGMTYEYMGS